MRKLIIFILFFLPLAPYSAESRQFPDYRYMLQGEWTVDKNYTENKLKYKPINISDDDVKKDFSLFQVDSILIGDKKISTKKGNTLKEYELFYSENRLGLIDKKDIYIITWFKIEDFNSKYLTLGSYGRSIILKRVKPFNVNGDFYKVKVEIEQDGKVHSVKNRTVRIKKREFSINLKMKKPMGVLINASTGDKAFKMVMEKKGLRGKMPFRPYTAMAEYSFNVSNDIKVSDGGNNHWRFTSIKEHSFNKVIIDKHQYHAKRDVYQVHFVDDNRVTLLADIKEKALYLVFFNFDDSGYVINCQPLIIEFE